MTDTKAGLALRSTDRATPMVILGLAMLLGAGVTALWARLPWVGLLTGLVLVGLVVADNPAIFNGTPKWPPPSPSRPRCPRYETAAIRRLNTTHPGTRVLAIPGEDFAAYR